MNFNVESYDFLPSEAKEIRTAVFVIEQGFNEEFDTDDHKAIHFLVFDKEKAIGTARIIFSEKHRSYAIGRVAILKEYRNKHIGKLLMEEVEKEALKRFGHINIGVSAQERVAIFYEKLGYQYTNERYLDENCPHVWMIKKL